MAALTLRCPRCGEDIVLPATMLASDHNRGTAVVQIDQVAARAHLEGCATTPKAVEAAGPSQAELAGRVHRMLATGAFVATGGSRACLLCGCKGKDCMDTLTKGGAPCCSGCANGDTHPVPKGTLSCAEWAAEHHQAQQ